MATKDTQKKLEKLEEMRKDLEKLYGFFSVEKHRTSGSEIVRVIETGANLSVPLTKLLLASRNTIAEEESRLREAIGKEEVPM